MAERLAPGRRQVKQLKFPHIQGMRHGVKADEGNFHYALFVRNELAHRLDGDTAGPVGGKAVNASADGGKGDALDPMPDGQR